ncbi:FecR domain-containing protein [Pedobacter sp. N36a]|uniref:FecR family protein n=1 Tax=Pedobacter sp. N36a TaxID=2767996 RepID=UPI001657643C|nr:FecR family protein [Pedobacter sp. N36a]MBC8985987.1 FecR domain-containing protein [Pedobacter sp. N36a]
MEEKEELARLYQLYLSNRCTAGELNRFFTLIQKGKEEDQLQNLLSGTWDQTPMAPETGLIPYFLPQENLQKTAAMTKASAPRKLYPMFRYAAAIAAILLLFFGIYFYRSELQQSIGAGAKMEIASVTSSRRQIQLPDGTKVWLSPHSKLTYPAAFEGAQRLVSLDGEAFFEVAHDSEHPFLIKSGKVSTRVLGTSFNFSAYAEQEDVNVTLVTGKVAVSFDANGKTTEAIITANQRVSVNKKKEKMSTENFPDAKDFLNRRIGRFDYKGTPLSEVAEDLEMQYKVQIILAPELQNHHFYGHLNMNTDLVQTLKKLCTVMETNWEKDGGQYVITK